MTLRRKLMSDKKYPVSEIFTSIQGEGVYTGTVMTFIRLAGCSVGKKIAEKDRAIVNQKAEHFSQPPGVELKPNHLSVLKPYTEICTLYDGREFLCDTDFRT